MLYDQPQRSPEENEEFMRQRLLEAAGSGPHYFRGAGIAYRDSYTRGLVQGCEKAMKAFLDSGRK